jgi:hypothetical protein
MNESDYTQAVHKRLPAEVFRWKVRDDYQGGVPDAFYRRLDGQSGSPLWIEYKYLKDLPKRDTTLIVPNLSELQHLWLRRAAMAGEQVRVIVGHGSRGVVLSLDEAEKGLTCAEFKIRLAPYKSIAFTITSLLMPPACT